MIKFTSNNDFDFDMESVHLLKDSGKELVKRASAKELLKYEKTPGQEDLHVIALGAYEGTGCFFKGAPVQTITGIKPIEDITVGDLVLTHKGRYRKVTSLFENEFTGIKVSLNVTSLPEPIECTDNHPIQIIEANEFKTKHRCPSVLDDDVDPIAILDQIIKEKSKFVPAINIKPGDYVLTPINIDNEDKIQKFSEDDAYLFGYYLSEGCLFKEYREGRNHCGKYVGLLFTMAENDRPCINKLKTIIKLINETDVTEQKSYTSEYGVRIQFQNYDKAQQCLKLFGCHSTTKHISPLIFQQSLEWKLKFLAAYLDGDGSLISDDTGGNERYIGTLTASTASRNLAYDLQRLFASCGITSAIYKGMNKFSNGCFGKIDHVIYQVSVGGTNSGEILKRTLRLAPVKKEFFHKKGNSWVSTDYLVLKVKEITTSEIEDEVKYNLEVEEDNTYIVDIQVHNSNRNNDLFREEECKKNYHTFTKANRAVHKHHRNKPNDPKYGNIKAAAYNEKMKRIELVLGIDKKAGADILHEQETTGNTQWSMAAKIAHDSCTFCHFKATHDNSRCEHIPAKLGEINKEGVMCAMDNCGCNWFEISHVKRAADRIGMSLGKLASDLTYHPMLPSDYEKLYPDLYIPDDIILSKKAEDKRELLNKLSEMEKRVDAIARSTPTTSKEKFIKEHGHKIKHTENIDDTTMAELRKMDPGAVLKTLADNGIVLKPEDFSTYLFDKKVKPERLEGMKTHLPHIFSNLNKEDAGKTVNSETFEPGNARIPDELKSLMEKLTEGHSLKSEPVVRRIMFISISGKLKPSDKEVTKEACDYEFARKYAEYQISALNEMNEAGKLDDDIILNTVLMNQ